MKVLFVMPPFTQSKRAMKRCLFPLGLGYLAAILEKENIEVETLDCAAEGHSVETKHGEEITFGLCDDEIVKRIMKSKPTHVGVSSLMSRQFHNAKRICKITKEIDSNIQTIVGGTHPSALSELTIADPNIDTVVIGEGESVIVDVIKENQTGVVSSQLTSLENLPWPARHLFPIEKYLKINMPTNAYAPHSRVSQIEFTRGCPFRCCFCATTNLKDGYRKRPINDCLNEIRFLKSQYGIEELDVIDSNLIVDRTWTVKLLRGIKEIDIAWANPGGMWVGGLDDELLILMKESGCYQLSLAVESSTPRILEDVIHKPSKLKLVKPIIETCHRIGIDTHAFFVCGFPEQSEEEMHNDYEFAKRMNFTSASFNIISPLPGSDLYEKYKSVLLLDDVDLRKASIPHPTLSRSEIEKMVNAFNRNFNFSLIYRKPKVFLKKYVGTAMRKFSWNVIRNLFLRQ